MSTLTQGLRAPLTSKEASYLHTQSPKQETSAPPLQASRPNHRHVCGDHIYPSIGRRMSQSHSPWTDFPINFTRRTAIYRDPVYGNLNCREEKGRASLTRK